MNNISVFKLSISEIGKYEASYMSYLIGKEFAYFKSSFKLFSDFEWENYRSEHNKTIFFIAYSENKLLGFAHIIEINNIEFMSEKYSILGTGSLIAIEKGKGIGSLIVQEMKKFLESQSKSALGFCSPENTDFHLKNGRNVLIDGGKRIICKGIPSTYNLIYYNGEDNLIGKLIENTEYNILVDVDFW